MESAQPSYSSFLQKTLTKILLYGLPVLYFLVAVAFYLKTYDSAQIKITIVHLGGLFFVMLWLLSKIEEGNLDFFKKNFIFILPLLLYLFSGIVSFSMSPFKYVSLNEVAKRFIYCGLALIIIDKFNDEKKIMSLFNWLVAAAYIVCIYGIVQIIDYRFFPPPPDAGLDPFLWRQAFGNRIFSTFGNPNFFGDFLVVMSPVTLSLYIYRRKFYLLFLWAMIAVCLFATMSKGAWLGFAAGIFVFAVMYAVTFLRDKINAKTAIAIALVVVVFVAGAGLGIGILTKKRTDSASFRIFTWMSAWEMINTNPVIGTGIGSFYVTYPSWRRPQIFFIEHGHNTESDHPENEYLEVWFDEGIIGLTIFLLLIAFVFTAGYKNILYAHNANGVRDGPIAYIQLAVFAAFAAQLAHDFVCVSLRFVSSGIMLWFLMGVTISVAVNICSGKAYKNDAESVIPAPVKIALQIIAIAAFAYAMVYFAGYFKADLLHSRAISMSKQGDFESAINTYEEINKANPSFPMSRYFEANIYIDRWKAGDAIMAERTFHRLWKLAPNYVQSKFMAGVAYSKMWSDAVKLLGEYEKAKKPQNVIDEQKALIDALFAKAVHYYDEYMIIDPIFAVTYYRKAELYRMTGDHVKAEEVLRAHLNYPENLHKPPHSLWDEDWESRRYLDYSETHTQIGNLYLAQGKYEDAKKEYLIALELTPKYITAKKYLAVVYANLGDNKKAYDTWIEVYNLDPKDPDANSYLQSAGYLPKAAN